MPNYLIIDAHQDLAYNSLSFGRNYLLSAAETRRLETDPELLKRTGGQCVLGWNEYQLGQVALIIGTLFLAPKRYQAGDWETQVYATAAEAAPLYRKQYEYYQRLCGENPDKFRLIRSQRELNAHWQEWLSAPATPPPPASPEQEPAPGQTHPVGIVLSLEGAEGLRSARELEEWWEAGLRLVGPVWSGTRFCGGTHEPGGFTREGFELLEIMGSLGYTLDLAHMNEKSALQALDAYQGPIIASHANARALLKNPPNERHLSDLALRRLIERDGILGVLPFSRFLNPAWSPSDDRRQITLSTLAAHIDHVCQLAGNAQHVALGTDFDGGFGWPAIPYEMNTIADLQKLVPVLQERGYNEAEIAAIFSGNWHRHLSKNLPA